MQDKENMISIREFTESFYSLLLDDIRWNTSELLIMYRQMVLCHRFSDTFNIRDNYGTDT
jgi:hypothetical protein